MLRIGICFVTAGCLLCAAPLWAADSFFDGVFELSALDGTNGFLVRGIDVNDESGWSVSNAGDVNDDGIDDLVIGARHADAVEGVETGESYVVFGGAGLGIGGVLDLADLDGTNGFALRGIAAEDDSGYSVSGAGDVNGDGVPDLVIGALGADPYGRGRAGESYVVFGGTGVGSGGVVNLSALNGTNGFALRGVAAEDWSGFSVSSAGDVNSDGIDDLVIGAIYADPSGRIEAGESYVVFGRTGIGSGGVLDLSGLDGTNGFVLRGIVAGDFSGHSVSSAGDVNGDGVDDLVIGATGADPNGNANAGESYVVFGRSGVGAGGVLELSALSGANGFVIKGIAFSDSSGFSVSSAGDFNGDGADDLVIGAPTADPYGNSQAGESYVVFGGAGVGAGGVLNLSALNGTNGLVLLGIAASDESGYSVSSAGDVNGDGVDDLLIGAPYASPHGNLNAGESYVVYGASGIGGQPASSSAWLNLGDLNGANGFVLRGITPSDLSGLSVSNAGDVNGDGADDLVIGAPWGDRSGNPIAGESYVVFGALGFIWTPVAGGDFDVPENWLGRVAPTTTGGAIVIRPDIGGTITGPFATVIADRLVLGAELANTATLDIPATGAMMVREEAIIESRGRLAGEGIFFAGTRLTNDGEIDLGVGLQVGGGPLANRGLIRGVGRIDAEVTSTGRIEAFDQSGEMEFERLVTNEASGLVAVRSSVLRLAEGLENQGQVSFAAGTADVFGDVDNTGITALASSATVNLVGDVVQNGSLKLLSGSRMTVYGDFSGTGGTSGPGTLEVLGTLAPGNSTAAVSFGGDLVLGPGAALEIELGGTVRGAEYDALDIAGTASLAGTLDVLLVDLGGGMFAPAAGDRFDILSAAHGLGGTTFTTELLPELGAGLEWNVNYTPTSVVLEVLSALLAGDYNQNGTVDAADYVVWRDNFGTSNVLPNDPIGGTIGQAQYDQWRANFGQTAGSGALAIPTEASSGVPEPSLLSLAVLAMFTLALRWPNSLRQQQN